jgi:dCTP deaminase
MSGAYLPGILAQQDIRALAEAGAIASARPFDADQIQPASLDLRLGTVAHQIGRAHV